MEVVVGLMLILGFLGTFDLDRAKLKTQSEVYPEQE